jgi:hypothetical protein
VFSPQVYIRSHGAGSLLLHSQAAIITLADETTLEFPLHSGSNLPFMLSTTQQHVAGLTYNDATSLPLPFTVGSMLSVADQVNQNITPTQKELLS